MKKHFHSIAIIVFVLIILLLVFLYLPKGEDQTQEISADTDTVQLTSPDLSSVIQFPLTIEGVAPNDWYLDDQLVVRILDDDGKVLHTSRAFSTEMVGEQKMVAFSATIEEISEYEPGTSATLLIIKGDLQNIISSTMEAFSILLPPA